MYRLTAFLMDNSKAGRITQESGFAYIWVLAFVMILSVGIGIVMEMDALQRQREQEQYLLAIGREFQAALRRYHEILSPAGEHEYPERLEDLVSDTRFHGQLRRHLRKIHHDPMTGLATWGFQLEAGRIVGVYSLSTKQPIKQDGFDVEEDRFKGANSYREWIFMGY